MSVSVICEVVQEGTGAIIEVGTAGDGTRGWVVDGVADGAVASNGLRLKLVVHSSEGATDACALSVAGAPTQVAVEGSASIEGGCAGNGYIAERGTDGGRSRGGGGNATRQMFCRCLNGDNP